MNTLDQCLDDIKFRNYEKGYKKGRKDAIDEIIKIARAEIDFIDNAEQARFCEFLENMKVKK